ncbi:bifunctional 5,10-methylenetetrahydrofolate dehydrogenase/5,10-methenyltetrahydrofolate cyclohydrolase [Candidatus Saccharibacteria bacterium]|nr:bifunctional 5,10-methylenetetrahydrofolate dehydrogenase/5,10-methenyltetrahydrofolate cyclohydrolase [Candidatus Saccharibacteria bacterium]
MTKFLNGRDLADFIKERQAKQVRGLIQHDKIQPRLAILTTSRLGNENPPIETYMRMKHAYGEDIQIEVDIIRAPQDELLEIVNKLNEDDKVHGIIIQLPLDEKYGTDEIVNAVAPAKDVDALGKDATLDPATPLAIIWLLAGYNIELKGKKVVIVGNGRLVGKPLTRMLRNSGVDVEVVDIDTPNPNEILRAADVIISATGVANLIKSSDVKIGAVVVDAGTSSEQGRIVGDVAPEVRERSDLTITPEKGGVGPLTIVALMDNTIRAARATIRTAD